MKELAEDLRQEKHSKSADTIDRFSQDILNHRACQWQNKIPQLWQ